MDIERDRDLDAYRDRECRSDRGVCAVPLMGSLGAAGVVSGLATGHWIVASVVSAVAVVGVLGWCRRVCRTDADTTGTCSVRTVDVVGSVPGREAGR